MARTAVSLSHDDVEEMTAHEAFEAGDFDAILGRQAEEISEPDRTPSGRWKLRNVGFFIRATPKEDLELHPDWPIGRVIFYHTPVEPVEGVDPDAVEKGTWRGRRIQTTRQIKEVGDDAKVKAVCELHGVSPSGKTLREMLEACKGKYIEASVSVNSYTRRKGTPDAEEVITDQLGNFTRVED